LFVGICFVILVTSLSGLNMVPVASHNPNHGNGGTTNTSSLTLVLLNSTDGVAHYGQSVTFNISTTATSYPNVSLYCYQNGALVYAAAAGFYPGYPWPGSQTFILAGGSWYGGAASCTATLYYYSGTKTVNLTTLNVPVSA